MLNYLNAFCLLNVQIIYTFLNLLDTFTPERNWNLIY